MKNILVPTDFSEQSGHAFRFARSIALKTKAKVSVLHVADLPVVADPMGTNLHAFLSPDTISMMEEKIKSKLKEFTRNSPPELQIEHFFDWGNPFAGITKMITDIQADLVVIGSRGASGAKEIFFGSNAERIIRNAKAPVITVKSEVQIKDIKKIVFGTDGEICPKTLVHKIKGLCDLFGAELFVVRINTPLNFMRDAEAVPLLEKFMDENDLKNASMHIYNDLNEDGGLMHFAESVKADLIALGTHGKRGFEHFLSGSIAEDIVNHAKRPIWTCALK